MGGIGDVRRAGFGGGGLCATGGIFVVVFLGHLDSLELFDGLPFQDLLHVGFPDLGRGHAA